MLRAATVVLERDLGLLRQEGTVTGHTVLQSSVVTEAVFLTGGQLSQRISKEKDLVVRTLLTSMSTPNFESQRQGNMMTYHSELII